MSRSNPLHRNRQLIRQWRLLQLLTNGRRTLQQLTCELAVTERTIRRDLACLEEAHFPIVQDFAEYGRGYWSTFNWRAQ